MSGNFNGQILVEKLSKLNSTQQSIETLSHWCIFHRKNAKQVVETWDKQFHCSSRDRRISFLYLANDILQNSRRKGSEFVVEFWKVLVNALTDVLKNGDDSDRRAAMRLVDIWEQRKVFGSRGQALKEELLGRNQEDHNINGRNSSQKSKSSHGEDLENIMMSYDLVYNSSVDEDSILRKCQDAISSVEKLEKDARNDLQSGSSIGAGIAQDLMSQHAILREVIEQLKATESSRARLVSHLRDAIQEQELKLQQVHAQLQSAQMHSDISGNLYGQNIQRNNGEGAVADQRQKEGAQTPEVAPNFIREPLVSNEEKEKSSPVMYTPQKVFPENPPQNEDNQRKSAAAAVAAKLAASTSSAQMLSYVLSSLASEGVIGQQMKDENVSTVDKRPRLDNGASYTPILPTQPPPPAFPHPDSLQQMAPPQPLTTQLSVPIPSSNMSLQSPIKLPLPPLQQPLHPNQFMMNAGPMTGMPYSYGSVPQLQQPPPLPNYQMPGMVSYPGSVNPFHRMPSTESSGFPIQPPLPSSVPPAFSHP